MYRLKTIRTLYPHWGVHSGINQYIKYLNPEKFIIKDTAVPMGDEKFPLPFLRNLFVKNFKKRGMKAYDLNDFTAELLTLFDCLLYRYDAIHLLDAEHSLLYLPTWIKILKSIKKPPKIIGMFHQPPSILAKLINMEVVKKLDQIVVVAPDQVEYFQRYISAPKISMILHGIDTNFFRPGNSNNQKFKCIAAGVWFRDYNTLIETAKLLIAYKNIEFHIISSKFDFQSDLKNIFIHKNISDDELLGHYQSSALLFMPMLYATANNVLLEGSACGLPILSTDLKNIRAYFPGDEAFLIQKNDPEAFADIILDLYNNPEKRNKSSKSSRERALSLSWQNIAKEYERLYIGMLSKS